MAKMTENKKTTVNKTCLTCKHRNINKTNNFGQIKCKKFSFYVSTTYCCNEFKHTIKKHKNNNK